MAGMASTTTIFPDAPALSARATCPSISVTDLTDTRRRFQSILPIAAGSMGTIHLAVRTDGDAVEPAVVVKRVHPHLENDLRVCEMLMTEGRCLSAIQHENVVAFVDYDTSTDVPALVMEHVEGTTLGKLARSGLQVTPSVALAIALQLCSGLEAVQAAKDGMGRPLGIVHRDLSPQNMMVDVMGCARIIDFGVARLGNDLDPGLFGKITYMAPETLETGIATYATDLFSLSIVIWELFAGRRFDDADVPSLKSAAGDDARVLDPIFARALATSPSARFANVAELRRALAECGIAVAARHEIAALVAQVCEQEEAPVPTAPAFPVVDITSIAPPARPTWSPFDVDRPAATARHERARRLRTARRVAGTLKWAGLFSLAAMVAMATNAIAELADDGPAPPEAVQIAAG